MESDQYEELCRRFIAEQSGLPLEAVQSVSIPNAKRPGLPEYKHQIDLHWETGDTLALYLNIANAKWRESEPVDQGDVLLLQQVRQQVAAHKAFMITNVGFTRGAVAAGKDHGIALHILKPQFDTSTLPRGDRAAIQLALEAKRRQDGQPLYSLHVEHRGFGFDAESPVSPVVHYPASRRTGYETRVIRHDQSAQPEAPNNRSIQPGDIRTSFDPGLGNRDGSGFRKK